VRRTDVEEAVNYRADQTVLKLSGIVDEELRSMPLGIRMSRQLSWLSISIVLNIVAASIVAFYKETLAAAIGLAVFLSIISGIGGSAGSQAMAVSLRELALGLVRPYELVHVLLKEPGWELSMAYCWGHSSAA
jgi:magnesium transporter